MSGLWAQLPTRHFVINSILIGLYPVIRTTKLNDYFWWADKTPMGLTKRDNEILMLLGVVIAMKSRKATTAFETYELIFRFAKIASAALFAFVDVQALLVYLVLWIIAFFIAPEMIYEGPDNIEIFNTFEWEKMLKSHEKSEDDEFVLLELFATWSPPCQHLAPEFAELSLKYSTPGLQFAKVDVGRNPPCAKTYGINTSATSPQIPTIILFKNGKEICRRPEVATDGSVIKCKLSRPLIETDFKLQDVYSNLKKSKRKGASYTVLCI